jgi:uncharacterized protein
MRALLDVNVLIALLDAGHMHHAAAKAWLSDHIDPGWASCPLTQNGCLRILSTPEYPRAQPLAEVAARLRDASTTQHHEFWPDDISVLQVERFAQDRWLTSRQITDAYLLGLAVHHGGRFVTLDRHLDRAIVRDATAKHLVVI